MSSQKKEAGICFGGIYIDEENQLWLIKESFPFKSHLFAIKEFIAGEIYQYFLNQNAPMTILVYDEEKNEILIGSKIIKGFHPWYHHVNGSCKILNHYEDVISAMTFICDSDANYGNMGFTRKEGECEIIKVDHGMALKEDCHENSIEKEYEILMRCFMWHFSIFDLDGRTMFCELQKEVLNTIEKIASVSLKELEEIIKKKYTESMVCLLKWNKAQQKANTMVLNDHHDTPIHITLLEDTLLNLIRNRYENFQKLFHYMRNTQQIENEKDNYIKPLISMCTSNFTRRSSNSADAHAVSKKKHVIFSP